MSGATFEPFDTPSAAPARLVEATNAAATFTARYQRASAVWRERLWTFRAQHPPRTLLVNGQRWDYLTGGEGRSVALLLHGSESDAESLFGAMTLLEPRYRVVAPTYPAGAATVAQVCDGLAALLAATGATADAPALVVGYSLGGYLAQVLAARRPALVSRLALCNTGGPARSALPLVRLQYALFAATPGPVLLRALRAGARLPLWREAPALADADREFWRAYLAEMTTHFSKRACLAHGRLIAEFLRSALTPPSALAQTPGRVLILDSTHDHTIEPAERAALGALYTPATRQAAGVGHMSLVTQPDRFVAAIEQEWQG